MNKKSRAQVVEEAQWKLTAHTLCLEQLYILTLAHMYTYSILVYSCCMNPGATLESVEVSRENRANWKDRQADRHINRY